MGGLLKVGVIGSGNFGGQVANAASLAGFPAMALNASKRDLETLDSNVIPFVIGDGNGTGKNGEYARQFLFDHISIVEDEEIARFINDNDVIVLAGSTGGGFGSNTIPVLIEAFAEKYPDALVIVMTTFPKLSEMYVPQEYTENFMRALLPTDENGITSPIVPYIIYDNDKYKDLTSVEMSSKIIGTAVEDLKVMRGDYVYQTITGGIDERDLLTTLSQPGRIVISKLFNLDEKQLVDGSIVKTIRADIDSSAQTEFVDDKLINASAVMYNIGTTLSKYTHSIETDMQTVFGQHIGDYKNEVIVDEDNNNFVVTILAGLTEPTTRINKVIARRQAIEADFNNRKASTSKLNSVQSGSLGLSVKGFGGTKTSRKLDTEAIIRKYGRPNILANSQSAATKETPDNSK